MKSINGTNHGMRSSSCVTIKKRGFFGGAESGRFYAAGSGFGAGRFGAAADSGYFCGARGK